ncbi:amino acid permease 5-like [Gossypium australe]|uniref:Amino acid permease 5-like n=1 Tax=Gossypium australe TaxID=47621 RepID=A0A5B6VX82_9ROSI|nr:amino acid permease 5-like [Gossypium australe]
MLVILHRSSTWAKKGPASCTLTDSQLNYITTEKELLAIEFDLEIRDKKVIENQVADHLFRIE